MQGRTHPCVRPEEFLVFSPGNAKLSGELSGGTMPYYSRDVKIGQLVMVGFRGRSLSEDSHIRNIIRNHHLGSVVLFDDVSPFGPPVRGNVESPEQLKALTREIQNTADIPLFIALDHEGGSVNRLKERYGFPPVCPASEFGDRNDETFTREESERRAKLLKELGVNVNLAPVVDVNVNPQNPALGLRKRCISHDPEIVTRHARIMLEIFHDYGIYSTLKHFPGHGSSTNDSHFGLVDVTDGWCESELHPFKTLISEGFSDFILTAHAYNRKLDSDFPGTLSRKILTDLLRNELGFKGVIISDDMNMAAIHDHYDQAEAVEIALNAGVDILAIANANHYDPEIALRIMDMIREGIRKGRIQESVIDRSFERIIRLKQHLRL